MKGLSESCDHFGSHVTQDCSYGVVFGYSAGFHSVPSAVRWPQSSLLSLESPLFNPHTHSQGLYTVLGHPQP